MKKFILGLLMIIMLGFTTYAQNPAPSDQDVDLMQRSQMVAEIKMLRAENSGLKDINSGLKLQIKTYDQLIASQDGHIVDLKSSNDYFKEALLHSKNSESLSDKMENLYKAQISDFKIENQRLRDDNDKLRKSRDRKALIFGAVGAVLGHFIF